MDASKIKQKMLEPLKVTRVAKRMGQMDKPEANVGVSKAGVTILDKKTRLNARPSVNHEQ